MCTVHTHMVFVLCIGGGGKVEQKRWGEGGRDKRVEQDEAILFGRVLYTHLWLFVLCIGGRGETGGRNGGGG